MNINQAEIQNIGSDGQISLHTRSLKYGKLENGQLIVVPPSLVKRLPQVCVDHNKSTQYAETLVVDSQPTLFSLPTLYPPIKTALCIATMGDRCYSGQKRFYMDYT
jgi:hypothetical protein